MASLALQTGDLFSIVTTGARPARSGSQRHWPIFGGTHVDYAAETHAQRNLWAARLDEAVLRAEKPVLLIASGESCFAAAWWARLSPAPYVSRVAGALLFAPKRQDEPDKFASPRGVLPFPSTVIDARASRSALDERVLALARGWGSELLERGEAAGNWQQAQALLARLTAHIVERRLRVADALGVSLAD